MKLIAFAILGCAISAFAQTEVVTTAQTSKPTSSPKKKADETNKNLFETESKTEGPITTEIYADEASFDSGKNVGVFTGHVKVFDPRFNLQSDKLTVYLHKGEEQGLEKAIAEGNVGLIRDRPNPNGGPPTHAVGRADKATYTATTGDVELVGTPRVQEGPNLHVATSPDTVMVVSQNSQLRTHGPSRTEIVGLLGPNGAGKTTSFYMIVGLIRPNSGRVIFSDTDVTDYPMYKRARLGMGYLPQEESIFRKMTVEQNILAILETLSLSKAERRNRCDQLLHQFGIERIAKNVALTLSGGEKRRLTIARSLVTQPKLLMLDEPFSGVDPIAVYDVQQIIVNLRKSGLAIMITDHNVRETLSIVDRAYLIYDGRVESEGTKDFLINDPISRQLYLGE